MAHSQPEDIDIASTGTELPTYAWSGAGKTIAQLQGERRAFMASLPATEVLGRGTGEHFAHMEDVWGTTESSRLSHQDFLDIKRSSEQGQLYASCYRYIDNEIRDPDWTSGTANQRGNSEKVDPVGNLGGQSAHLLSHAKVCHRGYPFLAEAAIGIRIEDLGLSGRANTNRLKLLVGVKGGHHFTSLKGHKFNKMYWKLQGEHFDSDDPSILVVPLLSMDQILSWTRSNDHAVEYDVAVFTFGERKDIVAAETLQYAKGTCSPSEIARARENLSKFVKGIASHLVYKDVFESLPEKYFVAQNASLLRWRSHVARFRQRPKILIPTALVAESNPNICIVKARMTTGTSLPDPWLLLAKSAINYTFSNKQNVMPACEPADSDDDSTIDGHATPNMRTHEDGAELDSARADFCQGALERGGFAIHF